MVVTIHYLILKYFIFHSLMEMFLAPLAMTNTFYNLIVLQTHVYDTEAAYLDLHLSISKDIVSTKIYDKRDDFDFEIVNFLCLDGDVPRSTSYGVYISQLIRFARAFSYVAYCNTRN